MLLPLFVPLVPKLRIPKILNLICKHEAHFTGWPVGVHGKESSNFAVGHIRENSKQHLALKGVTRSGAQ